jgi:hypothetical protein
VSHLVLLMASVKRKNAAPEPQSTPIAQLRREATSLESRKRSPRAYSSRTSLKPRASAAQSDHATRTRRSAGPNHPFGDVCQHFGRGIAHPSVFGSGLYFRYIVIVSEPSSSAPQPLEPGRVGGGVLDGMFDLSCPRKS